MNSNKNSYIIAAAISLMFSLSFVSIVVYSSFEKINDVFEQKSQSYYQNVSDNLKNSKVVLDGVTALFQTMGEVDNDQLSQYAREMLDDYPYLHEIEYFSKVNDIDRKQFELSMHESGYINFAIKSLVQESKNILRSSLPQKTYFPLVFMEPLSVSRSRLLGLDGLSDRRVSSAFVRAITTGESSITSPLDLLEGGKGLVLFKAVYTKSVLPKDFEIRKDNAYKVVAVLIRIEDLLASGVQKIFSSTKLNQIVGEPDIPVGGLSSWAWSKGFLPIYHKTHVLEFNNKKFNLELSEELRFSDLEATRIIFAIIFSLLISFMIFRLTHLRLCYQKDKQRAEEALYQEKEKAEITLYSIGDAVITTDKQGDVEFTNLVAEELIGLPLLETKGKGLQSLLMVDGEQNNNTQNLFWTMRAPDGLVLHKDPLTLVNQSGYKYVVEFSISPIHDLSGDSTGFVLVLRDVSHVRRLSRQLEYQATHDSLTDLINRSGFENRLQEILQETRNTNGSHALCYMDLDQFKIVNDSCGHLAGDHLLKQLATLMKTCIRDTDLLARLGGDEFGVLLFDCPVSVANTIAQKIKDMVSDFRFVWDEHAFDVGISIGLVPINNQSISAIELMKNADTACYVAKDKGRNRIHIYEEDDSELAQRFGDMLWVQRIRNALDEERFFLAVQDVVSLDNSDSVKHREILIRLHAEDGEMIPPMAFIPAAERYDLMPQIDKWVFSHTLEMIGKIDACECLYNINISGQSLKDADFSNYVRLLLQQSNVEPARICFEITETAAISNLTNATQFIHEMKELGIRFALDDFGRGMSSFGYLKTLPVDYLKIDGSFVRDMATDATDYAMVESITRIGHVMGLQVIAEFVENDATVILLRELGVDYAQGYGIHKPETWLVENGCSNSHV